MLKVSILDRETDLVNPGEGVSLNIKVAGVPVGNFHDKP